MRQCKAMKRKIGNSEGVGGIIPRTIRGGGKDIFWNHTFEIFESVFNICCSKYESALTHSQITFANTQISILPSYSVMQPPTCK